MTNYNENDLDNKSKEDIKEKLYILFDNTAKEIREHYEKNHLFKELAYQFYKIDEKFYVASENGYLNTTVAIENEIFEYLEFKAFEYSLSELLTILLYDHSTIVNSLINPNEFAKQSYLMTEELLAQFKKTLYSVVDIRKEKTKYLENIEKEKQLEIQNMYKYFNEGTKNSLDNEIPKSIEEKAILKEQSTIVDKLVKNKFPIIYKNDLPDFSVKNFFLNIYPYIQDIYIVFENPNSEKKSLYFDSDFICIIETMIEIFGNGKTKPATHIKFAKANIEKYLQNNKKDDKSETTKVSDCIRYYNKEIDILNKAVNKLENEKEKLINFKYIFNKIFSNDFLTSLNTSINDKTDYLFELNNNCIKDLFQIKTKNGKVLTLKASTLEIDKKIMNLNLLAKYNLRIDKTFSKLYSMNIMEDLKDLDLYQINQYEEVLNDFQKLLPTQITYFEKVREQFFENFFELYNELITELEIYEDESYNKAKAANLIKYVIEVIKEKLLDNSEATNKFYKLKYKSSQKSYLIMVYLFITGTINVSPDSYKFVYFSEDYYIKSTILRPIIDAMKFYYDDYIEDYIEDSELRVEEEIKPLKPFRLKKDNDVSN